MDDYDALEDFDFEQTLGPGPLPPSAPAFSTAVPASAPGAAASAEPSAGPGAPGGAGGGNFGARTDGFGGGSSQHAQPPYQQQQQQQQHQFPQSQQHQQQQQQQQLQQPHQQQAHDMGGGHGGGPPPAGFRRNYRQTVCRHWLRGLCMKGNDCGFLHQYDKSRMPVCRYFARWGECREVDCVYKHTNEDVKECNMYVTAY
ncbi:unnamed protein product [Closterium sp. Yama58-4]|nr:unnamed protein product [Closterium sp. Yama58-4]